MMNHIGVGDRQDHAGLVFAEPAIELVLEVDDIGLPVGCVLRVHAVIGRQYDGRAQRIKFRDVWEFLRGNYLSHRVWDGYEAILEACCHAWNKLMQMTERIASLTKRPWAKAVTG